MNLDLSKQAINHLIKINDSLRIKIEEKENKTYQYIKKYEYYDPDVYDLSKYSEEYISEYIKNFKKETIKLYDENLFKIVIIQGRETTTIIFHVHHVISDAWGIIQVAEQFKDIYNILKQKRDINTYIKPSYIEVLKKQEEYKCSDKYIKDREFWNGYIEKIQNTNIYGSLNSISINANRIEKNISEELFSKISNYCRENKITTYTFFLGIISTYYSKVFRVNNITIGTPFLNRKRKTEELSTVGMFVSTLPLNIDVGEKDTFITLCQNVLSSNLSCYKHSKFPYLEIQKQYNKINNTTGNLYEICFSYQISKLENKIDNDIGTNNWLFSNEQNNPVTINFVEFENKKMFYYDYLLDCMQDYEIEQTHNRIIEIINQVLANKEIIIEDINLLSEQDIKALKKLNDTGLINQSEETVVDLFDRVCKKYSNNIAIKQGNESITYKELNRKTTILAKKLKEIGVSKNTPVAIVMDKSIEMIISMFAVLKSNGCYVNILPEEEARKKKIYDRKM